MSPRLVTQAILAGALLTAPVLGQETEYSTKETRALMHDYARCVVEKQARKASEALLSNVDSGTILRRYRMLIVEECVATRTHDTVRISFRGDFYKYALADALVSREFADKPAPALADVPALNQRQSGEPPQQTAANGKKLSKQKYEEALQSYKQSVAYSFLAQYGECVARLDPAGAKALLLTAPDSQEETTRFALLKPAMASCLPEGRTLEFGRVALRGTIAVNYYRLARAAAGRAAG